MVVPPNVCDSVRHPPVYRYSTNVGSGSTRLADPVRFSSAQNCTRLGAATSTAEVADFGLYATRSVRVTASIATRASATDVVLTLTDRTRAHGGEKGGGRGAEDEHADGGCHHELDGADPPVSVVSPPPEPHDATRGCVVVVVGGGGTVVVVVVWGWRRRRRGRRSGRRRRRRRGRHGGGHRRGDDGALARRGRRPCASGRRGRGRRRRGRRRRGRRRRAWSSSAAAVAAGAGGRRR